MKKRIFIGSSLESKDLAFLLQSTLQNDFECVLWYEDFFSLGNHYYTDLIQKIITFDYAIMIGGADDHVTRISTGCEKIAPRDNVYLEYGLFSGVLSPKRVLLLIHENCTVASDLLGMSLSQYRDEAHALSIAKEWVEKQTGRENLRALSQKDVGILPSVGIAVGYYYNFLKPFLDRLSVAQDGEEMRLTVLVPTFVCDDVAYYNRSLMARKKLKEEIVQKFRILVDPSEKDCLSMYDIPSTVLALFKTVNYIFGISEGNTEDTLCAKLRALDDFHDNLRLLIENDYIAKRIVRLERYAD